MNDAAAYTTIGHRGMTICNPIGSDQLDALLALIAASGPRAGRALDVGCGKAELLIRLCERSEWAGLGIDPNATLVAEARAAIAARAPGRVEIVEGEADPQALPSATYDLAAAIGASHALGGTDATLAALAATTRPGGHVLLGDGFWRRAPDAAALDVLGFPADELRLLPDLVGAADAAGLEPVEVAVAREHDWDRYEWAHLRNLEAHAAAHPDDPQAARLWARRKGWRDAYLRAGRDHIGFALVLARKR
jgi:SAM-dependent methyltransferase